MKDNNQYVVVFDGNEKPVIKSIAGDVEMEQGIDGEIKMSVTFNGEDGLISKSKNCQGVLRTGVGEYIINPSDEERYYQYRKEHPTKWDKFKMWFKK